MPNAAEIAAEINRRWEELTRDGVINRIDTLEQIITQMNAPKIPETVTQQTTLPTPEEPLTWASVQYAIEKLLALRNIEVENLTRNQFANAIVQAIKWYPELRVQERDGVFSLYDVKSGSSALPHAFAKPRYNVGEIVYVREVWCDAKDATNETLYRATWDSRVFGDPKLRKFRSSIHLPESRARIWLKVMRVGVELVNAISEEDALAEGISWPDRDGKPHRPPIDTTGMSTLRLAAERYEELYNSINGQGSFQRHWCFAYDLQRVSKPSTTSP